MVGRSNLVADCPASETNLSKSDLLESGGKFFPKRHRSSTLDGEKLRSEAKLAVEFFFPAKRRSFVAMTAIGCIPILVIVVVLFVDKSSTAEDGNDIGSYFEKPEDSRVSFESLHRWKVKIAQVKENIYIGYKWWENDKNTNENKSIVSRDKLLIYRWRRCIMSVKGMWNTSLYFDPVLSRYQKL